MGKKILITGGAGFIGSHLADAYLQRGDHVHVLDDLSTGDPRSLAPDVHFTRGDVNDRPKLWTLLQEVDCVYHMAARISVPESILYPREYNTSNVGGTVSLMEAMRDVGIRRVVLASSGAIYGDQDLQPLTEGQTPRPHSPYAVSKLAAEYYVRTIGSLWGIETVCLRIFNAYGPGQQLPPSNPPVIPYFLRQATRGGTLVIHGDGSQTRSFCFVDDLIEGIVCLLYSNEHQPVNIGNPNEMTILQFAEAINRITGNAAGITFVPDARSTRDPQRRQPDITRARESLHWEPAISLDEGIRRTIPYFKQKLGLG